jgi:hypothetical protein
MEASLVRDWDELRATLRGHYTLDDDGVDEVALTLPMKDGHARRAQRVMVQRYQAWNAPMVEVRSAFGELRSGEELDLLRQNLDLPLGAVALHGRYLVLLHKCPLSMLGADGLLALVARVAELADVLEERRGGDRF